MVECYRIVDRVPVEEINTLTSAAAKAWLTRNGWTLHETWAHRDGVTIMETYRRGGNEYALADHERFIDHGRRMSQLIEVAAMLSEKRAHVVIAEIRAIAEWQKRCKEWVEPKEGGNCSCWACECKYADAWEAPPVRKFVPSCPTCDNSNCPRATDHRNECSGSNEPGQAGSRYA